MKVKGLPFFLLGFQSGLKAWKRKTALRDLSLRTLWMEMRMEMGFGSRDI